MWKNILMFLLALLTAVFTIALAAYIAFWSGDVEAKYKEPARIEVTGVSSAQRVQCDVYARFAIYVLENRNAGATKEDVIERSIRAASEQGLPRDQLQAIVEIIDALWEVLATPQEASQAVHRRCMAL